MSMTKTRKKKQVKVPFIEVVPAESAATLASLKGVILTTGCRELGEPTDDLAMDVSLWGVVGIVPGDPGTCVTIFLVVIVVVVECVGCVGVDALLPAIVAAAVVGTRINWTGGRRTRWKASI